MLEADRSVNAHDKLPDSHSRTEGNRNSARFPIEIGMHQVLVEIVLAHSTDGTQNALSLGLAGRTKNHSGLPARTP